MNKSDNIKWHPATVGRQDRERLNGHKGCCLWFTGLSGSGKSTLANEVETLLNGRGIHSYLLDGDNIRHGLNSNLGFSDEDRTENIRRIAEVAKLFVDAGIVVLTAFVSPFREDRDKAREIIDDISGMDQTKISSDVTLSSDLQDSTSTKQFVEIFVDVDLATCESRDPKGLYKMARAGGIKDFTGIDSPYEKPLHPELTIQNDNSRTVRENALKIIEALEGLF